MNVIDDTKHGKYCEALTSLASIKAEIATAESDEARQDVLNKLINVTSSDLKTSEDTMSVEITNVTTGAKEEKTVNKITGATVKAYHGIKKVLYDDGTVMEFYRELPTRLFVNCQLGEEFNGATVIDATGCPITITEGMVTLDYIDVVGVSDSVKEIVKVAETQTSEPQTSEPQTSEP